MRPEEIYGVNSEARKRNNEAIQSALEQLWEKALTTSADSGVLASLPLELETRGGGKTKAKLWLATSFVASESDSDDVTFEILARVSVTDPDMTIPKEVPNDPRILRPDEWAARQLHFVPHQGYYKYNKMTEYGTSAENHQQEGLVKALAQHATEAAAHFLVKKYRPRLASGKTQIIIADRSVGKGGLQLDGFGVKVASTLPGFTQTKERTFEKWIEV